MSKRIVKRADVPITAADEALAEHVLREKFTEFRRRTQREQVYDVCVDTATVLKNWPAMAAVHGNMGDRHAKQSDAESLHLAVEQYKLAAEFCRQFEPHHGEEVRHSAKLKEAHWKCTLAWTYKRSGHADQGFEAAQDALHQARGDRGEGEAGPNFRVSTRPQSSFQLDSRGCL